MVGSLSPHKNASGAASVGIEYTFILAIGHLDQILLAVFTVSAGSLSASASVGGI